MLFTIISSVVTTVVTAKSTQNIASFTKMTVTNNTNCLACLGMCVVTHTHASM